ncbi:hypothetical protein ACMUMQ_07990 [Marinomonas sp. 2405UD66-6]|uniref:hypothetical protein n=1 Tax=Marinomonas sp. 2405UD66-6 TaxID=3391834 RepID=UPI0039C8E342
MYQKKLEFGNYTLNFGSKLVLLDLLEEIVLPSFKERKYKRVYADTEYFFINTRIIKINRDNRLPIVGIHGKIVKNTKLKREQIYKEGELISNIKSLDSAPSSSFFLCLNNHRIILCKEMPGAPDLDSFKISSEKFLKDSHKSFLENEYISLKKITKNSSHQKIKTKKSLLIDYPLPNLRITPLSDKVSLESFVKNLDIIDKLSIKLLKTNSEEIDNDDYWRSIDESRIAMGSSSAKVDYASGKDGLNHDEVLRQTKSAVRLGNSDFKCSGTDKSGDKISGSNDDFKLSREIDEIATDPYEAASQKYQQLEKLEKENVISLPKEDNKTKEKIIDFLERKKWMTQGI